MSVISEQRAVGLRSGNQAFSDLWWNGSLRRTPRRIPPVAVRSTGMSQHRHDRSTTPIRSTPISLEPTPSERRGKSAVPVVLPGAFREPAGGDVAADRTEGCSEHRSVGGLLRDVDFRSGTQILWWRRPLPVTSGARRLVPPACACVSPSDESGGQAIEVFEIRRLDDDEGEFDEDLVSELGAEPSGGWKCHCEGLEENRPGLRVNRVQCDQRSDDPVGFDRAVIVTNDRYERGSRRVSGEGGLESDPAAGDGSVGVALVAGADLLLERGHRAASVVGVVRATVRLGSPGLGPDGSPESSTRVQEAGSGCPAIGPKMEIGGHVAGEVR